MSFPLIEFDTSLAGHALNEPRPGYRKIEVRLLAGSLGAEIFGVDLSQPVDDETFAEIHQAWLDHQVVFFRDQDITPERYKAFAARFSDLRLHELLATVPGHPEIQIVAKQSTDNYGAGHFWHSDVSFSEIPPMGSLLYAREVPDYGGDTLFANMYLAYDTLSVGMKEIIDQRQALHSATRVYNGAGGGTARDFKTGESGSNYRDYEHAERRVAHPMARTHPAVGRKSLYVNSYFTVGIVDMKDEEALPLFGYLFQHATKPEFVCRIRWALGSIAVIDNRCTQHYALNDYPGRRRILHRILLEGDRPQ